MRGSTQRQEALLPSGHSDKESGWEGPHRDKRTCFLQVTVTRGSLGERVHTETRGPASSRSQGQGGVWVRGSTQRQEDLLPSGHSDKGESG